MALFTVTTEIQTGKLLASSLKQCKGKFNLLRNYLNNAVILFISGRGLSQTNSLVCAIAVHEVKVSIFRNATLVELRSKLEKICQWLLELLPYADKTGFSSIFKILLGYF